MTGDCPRLRFNVSSIDYVRVINCFYDYDYDYDCLPALDCVPICLFFFFNFFSQTPREYTYRGYKNNNDFAT